MDERSEEAINQCLHIFKNLNLTEKWSLLNALFEASPCSLLHEASIRLNGMLKHDFLPVLPEEISVLLFSYLSCTDLCNSSLVCRTWNQLISRKFLLHRQASRQLHHYSIDARWQQSSMRQIEGCYSTVMPKIRWIQSINTIKSQDEFVFRSARHASSGYPCMEVAASSENDHYMTVGLSFPTDAEKACVGLVDLLPIAAPNFPQPNGRREVVTNCGHITAVKLAGPHVIVGNVRGTIYRQSMSTFYSFDCKYEQHAGAVYCMAVSIADDLLVSGGADRCIRLWSFKSGVQLQMCLLDGVIAEVLLDGTNENENENFLLACRWHGEHGDNEVHCEVFAMNTLLATSNPYDATVFEFGIREGLIYHNDRLMEMQNGHLAFLCPNADPYGLPKVDSAPAVLKLIQFRSSFVDKVDEISIPPVTRGIVLQELLGFGEKFIVCKGIQPFEKFPYFCVFLKTFENFLKTQISAVPLACVSLADAHCNSLISVSNRSWLNGAFTNENDCLFVALTWERDARNTCRLKFYHWCH